ncbi:hypothetical protein NKR19_g3498 [Coniochaeta hoffmannii]|uniref:Uncharacterized protein n=1 Tax=Coniochaeta hoffmannii TaxID=91930 RepID=A0AA38S8S0_9PEZI|nr:hypothetical protein NKR19_g3498 [Coniochaeta hoffmannii]
MASTATNEKADALGLTVETHALNDKPSHDTLSSDMPSAEKAPTRLSDVSTTHQPNPFDTDIEAIISSTHENRNLSAQCTRGGPECQVWPGQDHWRRKAKAAKRQRRTCTCLSHLSKRNRIIVKILIGLLVIGVAVGVGVGISKPLGARIWHPNDH